MAQEVAPVAEGEIGERWGWGHRHHGYGGYGGYNGYNGGYYREGEAPAVGTAPDTAEAPIKVVKRDVAPVTESEVGERWGWGHRHHGYGGLGYRPYGGYYGGYYREGEAPAVGTAPTTAQAPAKVVKRDVAPVAAETAATDASAAPAAEGEVGERWGYGHRHHGFGYGGFGYRPHGGYFGK